MKPLIITQWLKERWSEEIYLDNIKRDDPNSDMIIPSECCKSGKKLIKWGESVFEERGSRKPVKLKITIEVDE